MTQKKRILVVATGGTIACKRSEAGLKPVITSNELLSFVPDTARFCQADAVQVLNIDSTNIQPAHWLLMARTIEDRYGDYDGFVICHGTDTMAYTAAALSYLIQGSQKPIVITGAQKPIDLEITDAKTNLIGQPALCQLRTGPRTSTSSSTARSSPGPVGKRNAPKATTPFPASTSPTSPSSGTGASSSTWTTRTQTAGPARFYRQLNDRVALLKLIPSMDGGVLDYMADHYDAVIIESFGVGGIPTWETADFHDSIRRWVESGKIVGHGHPGHQRG